MGDIRKRPEVLHVDDDLAEREPALAQLATASAARPGVGPRTPKDDLVRIILRYVADT
jgi:hypothetical protein